MSQIANLSDAVANAMATALAPRCNSGTIQIYSGPQPANANTAVTGANTLLTTLTFGTTAWTGPTAGVLTANTITSGTNVASGTATFARIFQSDGTTVVMDIQVNTANAGLNLNSTNIMDGAITSVSSFTYSVTET